jgi:MinD-like ATPase involved in chromosome partitioning or flagellar assembly
LAQTVILDLGTSLPTSTEKVLPHCDEILVVVEPIPQTLVQSKALIRDLVESGIGEGRLKITLVNRVRSGVQLSLEQVQDQLGYTISASITPAPELAYQASLHNLPLVLQQPDSLTAQQYGKLAQEITQHLR